MKTAVKIGNHTFTLTFVRLIAHERSNGDKSYVERYGFGNLGWGDIRIEGQWLSETYSWHGGRDACNPKIDWRRGGSGKPYHPHSDMVRDGVAWEYGGAVPLNEAGMEMARNRVQWLASREPAILERWLYLKREREKASQVGEVTREQVLNPVSVIKPWREGARPHPEAVVYDLPGCKGSLPWWYTLPAPEGTPCGHPRFLCHFPATIPEEERWGKPTTFRAKARNENYRTDNGPAYNVGPVQLQLPEGMEYGYRAVGFHYEAGIYREGKLIGELLEIQGEIPEAPVPGLAYPGANRYNPAPVGGGHCSAFGSWADVTVRLLIYWPDPVRVIKIKAE